MEKIWGFGTCSKRIYMKNSLFCIRGLYNMDIRLWVNVVFSIIFVLQVSSCLYRHDCGGSRETWPLLLWKLFCRRSIQVAKSSFCYKTLRYQGIYNYCCLMVWERACFQHLIPFELTYLATWNFWYLDLLSVGLLIPIPMSYVISSEYFDSMQDILSDDLFLYRGESCFFNMRI
jgi:hypothetical protein